MPNPPSIDLGSVNAPARNGQERRSELQRFSDEELKRELLDRGVADFSWLEPWIRNGLLVIIFAACCVGYWNMKCQAGDLSGFVCSIAN